MSYGRKHWCAASVNIFLGFFLIAHYPTEPLYQDKRKTQLSYLVKTAVIVS